MRCWSPPAQLCLQRLHQPSLCLPTRRHTAQCSSLSLAGTAQLLQCRLPALLCICKAVLQHLYDALQALKRFHVNTKNGVSTDTVSATAA